MSRTAKSFVHLADYFNYPSFPLLVPRLPQTARHSRPLPMCMRRRRFHHSLHRTAKPTNAGPASTSAAPPACMCLRERPRAPRRRGRRHARVPAEAQGAPAVDRGALGETHHAPAQQRAPPLGGRERACLAVNIRCAPSFDPYQVHHQVVLVTMDTPHPDKQIRASCLF
ncbi:hypothetical protein PsYK624_150770 [Phanerochaete sordida]|uniref:Uncharacterized protein n=1 Tax=Phanerochaete sordida TaxID=48140 RepID=A0A9P3GNP7_9APHY|nr:hypothetical protein PsYK624_150770 [Phanerochaete sordida]